VRSATGRADANGIFHLDSLPVGARGEAVIRVRYLGYDSVDQLVRAPQLSASQLLKVDLYLRQAAIDGCNMGQFIRKPWWRWW
jgi:hypothetical protein